MLAIWRALLPGRRPNGPAASVAWAPTASAVTAKRYAFFSRRKTELAEFSRQGKMDLFRVLFIVVHLRVHKCSEKFVPEMFSSILILVFACDSFEILGQRTSEGWGE